MSTIKSPMVSVILPVYNCEAYISKAIDSILCQTFADFELLIIDDVSTDATPEIVKNYTDPRIQFITKPQNSGISESLNLGLQLAKGKYIARMDGDDISLPQRFEAQFKLMEANPDIVVCGTWLEILDSGKIIQNPESHEQILVSLLNTNPIGHPSIFIRKDALGDLRYDRSKEPAEDYTLWTKLVWQGKFHNIQEPLLLYRQHENQVSTVNNRRQFEQFNASRIPLFRKLGFDTSVFPDQLLKKLFYADYSVSVKEFRLLIRWFKEIKKLNQSQKIYMIPEFNTMSNKMLAAYLAGFFIEKNSGVNTMPYWFSLPPKLFWFVSKMYIKHINRKFKRGFKL